MIHLLFFVAVFASQLKPVISPPPEFVFSDPEISEKNLQEMKTQFDGLWERIPKELKEENELRFGMNIYLENGDTIPSRKWLAARTVICTFLSKEYGPGKDDLVRVAYRKRDDMHPKACIALGGVLFNTCIER